LLDGLRGAWAVADRGFDSATFRHELTQVPNDFLGIARLQRRLGDGSEFSNEHRNEHVPQDVVREHKFGEYDAMPPRHPGGTMAQRFTGYLEAAPAERHLEWSASMVTGRMGPAAPVASSLLGEEA
jgi:hypothetical protein